MGKLKQKNGNELKYLQGIIKQQAKKIKSLEMEVRSLQKHRHMFEIHQDEDVIGDTEDTFTDLKRGTPCDGLDGCGKGYFVEFEIMGRTYGTCNICELRKRLK